MKKKIRTIKDYFHYQTKQTPLKPAALPGAAPSAPRPATARSLRLLLLPALARFLFCPDLFCLCLFSFRFSPDPSPASPALVFIPDPLAPVLPLLRTPGDRAHAHVTSEDRQKTDAARSVSTKTTLCSSGTPRGKFSENDVL